MSAGGLSHPLEGGVRPGAAQGTELLPLHLCLRVLGAARAAGPREEAAEPRVGTQREINAGYILESLPGCEIC